MLDPFGAPWVVVAFVQGEDFPQVHGPFGGDEDARLRAIAFIEPLCERDERVTAAAVVRSHSPTERTAA